jgi:ligand-binding SRPBCC domain-containing protein
MITLEEITLINSPIERCFDLSRSIEVHLEGTAGTGERARGGKAVGELTTGLIAIGQQVTWSAIHFGVRQELTSRITSMRRPDYFEDRMVKGAFRSMEHEHFFRAVSPGRTEVKDIFRFAAPVPLIGWVVERVVLRRHMRNLLRERNYVLKRIAESDDYAKYLPALEQGGAVSG